MVKGRSEGYRELLLVLGRAAGLSGLALATAGAAACTCYRGDECATVEDLLQARAEGLADVGASGSAGSSTREMMDAQTAQGWDGNGCPSGEQYSAIVHLKLPNWYPDAWATKKDLGNGKCCYHVEEASCGQGGRPFLVEGRPRLADVSGAGNVTDWLSDARAEHASVAAFARLSLQLMAIGAPSELVRDAQLASLDELRHAELFFELASRAAGTAIRPGPLDVAGALDDLSLAGLIESNLREGCIGETLAAEQLKNRSARVHDPKLRDALLAVAEDETRHAELAFRILAWCRDTAPELTRQLLRDVVPAAAPSDPVREIWSEVLLPLFGALATA